MYSTFDGDRERIPAWEWFARVNAARTGAPIALLLAGTPDCPPDVLADIATTAPGDVAYQLAMNPSLPIEVLHHLIMKLPSGQYGDFIAERAALRPDLGEQALTALAARKSHDGFHEHTTKILVASHPNTSSSVLACLAADHEIGRYVAQNPSCPLELRAILARSERWFVAANPALPAVEIRRLQRSPDVRVRDALAANPAVSSRWLARVAVHRDVASLRALANPNCPARILTEVAWSRDVEARRAVASNPNAPDVVLRKLGQARSARILLKLMANPSCPQDVLATLAHRYAQVRPAGHALLSNPHCPEDVVVQLYRSPYTDVQSEAARRLPPSVLFTLPLSALAEYYHGTGWLPALPPPVVAAAVGLATGGWGRSIAELIDAARLVIL